jgi:hypothetical protein
MKRVTVVLVFSVLLFAAAVKAQTPAPKPGPEHQALGAWIGKWQLEYDNKLSGDKGQITMNCDWDGDGFFVVCRDKTVQRYRISIFGYSPEDKAYTHDRYMSTGGRSFSKVWVRGNTWTFVFDNDRADGKLRRRQMTAQISQNSFTFKYERSNEGEAWVITEEGKGTKGK